MSNQTQDTQLHILRLLQSRPQLTQRELAKVLGISLGKANYVLKALINRGWVKLGNFGNNPTKRDYLYLLTPSGISGKANLVAHFLDRKGAEYELLRKELESVQEIRDNQHLGNPKTEGGQE
jgi:EPS-associated MarR family transcriptional regulator